MDLQNFDWGNSNEWYISQIGKEVFDQRIYEKFFSVNEGEIVFDVGASTGIFTYSILDKWIYIIAYIQKFLIIQKNY